VQGVAKRVQGVLWVAHPNIQHPQIVERYAFVSGVPERAADGQGISEARPGRIEISQVGLDEPDIVQRGEQRLLVSGRAGEMDRLLQEDHALDRALLVPCEQTQCVVGTGELVLSSDGELDGKRFSLE
jgi:hypothetical protein